MQGLFKVLAGTCNAFSDGWGRSVPRRSSPLVVLRWVLVGQDQALPCSQGATAAFQPQQPLHGKEHTWAAPARSARPPGLPLLSLAPVPSHFFVEHPWENISSWFCTDGESKAWASGRSCFWPPVRSSSPGILHPSTDQHKTHPPTCPLTFAAPLAKPLEEAWGFCSVMDKQTDSMSNTPPPPAPPVPMSRPTGTPGARLCPEEHA